MDEVDYVVPRFLPPDAVEMARMLIEHNRDAYDWFEIAADESFAAHSMVTYFHELSSERYAAIDELQELMRNYAVNPDGSVSRLIARAMRDTLSLDREEAHDDDRRLQYAMHLLQRCVDAYEDALGRSLPEDFRQLVERHLDDLRETRRRVSGKRGS